MQLVLLMRSPAWSLRAVHYVERQMNKQIPRSEKIGRFREILGAIAMPEGAAPIENASEYREIREQLMEDEQINALLPEFVIDCRTPRDFLNYIQRVFKTYKERSLYIEAQFLPIERQFRPERQRSSGIRPPEVRIEYSPIRPPGNPGSQFIAETRIAQLRGLSPVGFDLQKLVRLCEELNVVYGEGCLLATAMLTRAMLDHVPPLFRCTRFSDVANNYSGGRSFKETMEQLDKAARKIADGYLHLPIRSKEILPTPQQVNFIAQIDALLSEIVRIHS